MSKDVDIKDLIEREGLWYEKFTNEPFTGKTTGRIQKNYKDGKLNGEEVKQLSQKATLQLICYNTCFSDHHTIKYFYLF